MERDTLSPDQRERLGGIVDALLRKDYATFDEAFLESHPRDQLIIYESLGPKERQAVYYLMTPKEMADLFDILDESDEHLEKYIYEMDSEYAASLIEYMQVDNAVDVLGELDDDKSEELLQLMDQEVAEHYQEILDYDADTAGSIMTTEFISIYETMTVQDTLQTIREYAPTAETIYYLYVVDSQFRLVGVISLRDLVVAESNEKVGALMSEDVLYVNVHEDQEDVAHLMKDYDFLALPVVDHTKHLLGIITIDDIVDVLDEESAEDYSGLAAVNVDERPLTPWAAARSRLPWLIILLVLGLGTSSLIGAFEPIIAEATILSAFISLVTGTAGNAGTQSLAVAIRRLTSRMESTHSAAKEFFKELVTGLLTGLVVGLASLLIVGLWQRDFTLGLIVGIAMTFAVLISTLAGTYVPLLIEKLGFDPAVASGPFITTLTDLTSVFIYFSVAAFFLNH